MKKKKIFPKGFSLIELLVTIAIISILASVSVGSYFFFKKNTDIDLGVQKVVNAIREAQGMAKAMKNDDAWGIDISVSRALIFKGTNFAGRTQSYDIAIPLQGLTSASGTTQFIFYKLTGLPYSASIGTLTLGNGNTTQTIQSNAEGLISY